jgi:hypothetical protein
MIGPAAFVAAGLATSLAGMLAIQSVNLLNTGPGIAEKSEPAAQGTHVNRTGKGDRLPFSSTAREHAKQIVTTVEVVGVRNAAVVYRDREGRILFSTDPLANVTVVAKDVELPELTIRETPTAPVSRMPLEPGKPPAKRHQAMTGCEPAVSAALLPTRAHIADRCLAEAAEPAAPIRSAAR